MTEQQARTLWRYMTNSNETRALLESMGETDQAMFAGLFQPWDAKGVARILRAIADHFENVDDSEALNRDDD